MSWLSNLILESRRLAIEREKVKLQAIREQHAHDVAMATIARSMAMGGEVWNWYHKARASALADFSKL